MKLGENQESPKCSVFLLVADYRDELVGVCYEDALLVAENHLSQTTAMSWWGSATKSYA